MREILSTEIITVYQYIFNNKYGRRKIIYEKVLDPSIYDSMGYFKLITTDTDNILEDTEI
jgi:hypothetical protein